MADVTLDARHEGDSYRRIEVITGQRRRRQWTAEEKAGIAAESLKEGANISEVARRHGVVRGLLTTWRRKFASAAGVRAAGFVPVRIDRGLGTVHETGNLPASPSALPTIAPWRQSLVAQSRTQICRGGMREGQLSHWRDRPVRGP
jgi:transposase